MNKFTLHNLMQPASLELIARQLVEGFISGLHKSPYHGFSVEFAEHRLYNEGESTRHIDWRVFARTDRLYTKRYEEETNLRCLIAIDHSHSMFYPQQSLGKLKFSIYASAALCLLLKRQRDAVGICLFSDTLEYLSPIKSTPGHIDKLLIHLENVLQTKEKPDQNRKTKVSEVLHELAEKIHKRSLVVLFSDMFDASNDAQELFKALQHLKHNHHEVIVFHVWDKDTEFSFSFEDRPHEFIDLETGEKIRLNPHQVRPAYLEAITEFHNNLKLKCHQYKIDFVEVDVKTDFSQILQAYLIKRGRMR